jgi:hypothetical protein
MDHLIVLLKALNVAGHFVNDLISAQLHLQQLRQKQGAHPPK